MKTRTEQYFESFFARNEALVPLEGAVRLMTGRMIDTFLSGGKLLLCGNGGSCADCDHIVGELMKGFLLRRPLSAEQKEAFAEQGASGMAEKLQQGLPAIALSGHAALVTAFGNDVDPNLIFAQQVLGYGRPGDLLLGISTSGNAQNVAAALTAANALGVGTIGLTGRDGGRMKKLAEICLVVPEEETYRIQEAHLALYHLLCAAVESELFDT